MKLRTNKPTAAFVILLTVATSYSPAREPNNPLWKRPASANIMVNVDTVLSDVSHHPIGINVNFFMDSDYFGPGRSTVDALKEMGVKWLRYPGGEKSDMYLWSVPPYDKPRPTMARTGEGAVRGRESMLDNYATFKYDVLDFDEFIRMCRQIGAEPVIGVAADEYLNDYPQGCTVTDRETLIKTAAEWVRYANIKKKYNVKYWIIGNETWHPENKKSTPQIYAKDVVDFAKAMKAVDQTIKTFPNGHTLEWWEAVLPITLDYIDGISISSYPLWGFEGGYDAYSRTLPSNTLGPVYAAAKGIEKLVPDSRKNDFRIIVNEYGPFDWIGLWPVVNDMGHAIACFEMTGEMLKHPRVLCSQFWNTRWLENLEDKNYAFDALDKNGGFNPTGHALAIWGNFLAKEMVYTSSPVVMIQTFASYDAEKKQLYAYIVNKSENHQQVALHIEGGVIDSAVQRWELVGKGASDTEPLWQKNDSTSAADPLSVTVPGTSITIIEYRLK
jgi:alpha-N-arabinofuranosidase